MTLAADVDVLLGAVLEDRFQIEHLLGEGGMGRVYAATELQLRRRCAVKVLLPEFARDSDHVGRFLREARTIAQLRHENIVEIYYLGRDVASGVVFFAMELLSGEDLESRLAARTSRPIAWQEACRWMAQVAGAVAAVHGVGMIHRDLKPANIFLHQDGRRSRVKLLDFGIARVADQTALTRTGTTLGTPLYMSPEQILAQPLDHRTDIYSFGVVLYEVLAGRPPFDGEPIQVAMQHCNIPPPPIGHAVPPEVEALTLALLAKDRTARPQAMADVEQQLLALASPAPVPAESVTPGQRPAMAARSGGRGIALVALGLVAALVLLLVLGRAQDATLAPAPAAAPDSTAAPAAVSGERSPVLPAALDNAHPPAAAVPGPAQNSPPPARVEAVAPPVSESPVPDVPKAQSSPTTEPKPRKAESRTERGDPLQRLAQAAAACRSTRGGSPLPKVTIDYAVGSDGSVTRAVPDQDSVLGRCLAGAVKRTKFSPGLRLGLQIEL